MRKNQLSNNLVNQVILLLSILIICLIIFLNLSYYLTGFLGAITLYILYRNIYHKLVTQYRWNRPLTSILFILLSVVFIILPMWTLINYLIPQVAKVVSNTAEIVRQFNLVKVYMSNKPILKNIDLSDEGLLNLLQNATKYIPSVFNSLLEVSVNILVTFFVLYFMLVYGERMERTINNAIPFSSQSKSEIWKEVFLMVKSNALGIPILGLCQGLVALIGYWFFGVENYITWGFLTAISSIIPVLGTMAIYVPLGIIVLATGHTLDGIGILAYGLFVIGSIDNILRFTILKSLGNVPPLITVFGVLLGLKLFGMMGLIFGPLILSSVRVLLKVYETEYGNGKSSIDI